MNSNSERTGVPIIYDKDHKNQTIMFMILVKYAMGHLLDLGDLVKVVLAREHRLVVDHLTQDASHTPNI